MAVEITLDVALTCDECGFTFVREQAETLGTHIAETHDNLYIRFDRGEVQLDKDAFAITDDPHRVLICAECARKEGRL